MKKTLFFAILALSINAIAQTNVPGGNVSGTWTVAGSPYIIQGSIQILSDSTLTIEPGVTVNFQGTYKMYVQGRVIAIGAATDTIIFTSADTTNGWRGIRFDNTPTANDTSRFFYCKFQYGKATGIYPDDEGGAFYFYNFSKAIISNSQIVNCEANNFGGGISCDYNSGPAITNNTISNNTANYGGGISCSDSPAITNNTISNNTANDGGGIYCGSGSTPTITNNTISNNTADGGGGIFCYGNSTIANNTISNNTANYGGGIYCYGSDPTIANNTLSNNTAYYGGAIYCKFSSSPAITNNTISNNTANDGGGIYLYNYECWPTITNTTISNNAAARGGALYCTGNSNPALRNTILYGNTAGISGAQLYLDDELSDPNFYYCDVQGGTAAFELNNNIYTGIYQNNIDSDPLFVAPSAGSGTGYNGVTADWSLLAGSLCIDAGDPNGTYPATDKAGDPRVVNSIIDMGAYEYQIIDDVAQYSLQTEFVVYPNPTSGKVAVSSGSSSITSIEIYNVMGEKVYQSSVISYSSSVNPPMTNAPMTIDLSFQPAGIYFCKNL